MDLSKFTEKSQAALTEAQAIGTRNQHQAVDVEHLALALLEQQEGLVPRLVEKAGVSPDLLKKKLQEGLDRMPRVSGDSTTGQGVYVTQRLNKLLVAAQDEAKKLKDEYVSVEHLVLAMLSEPAAAVKDMELAMVAPGIAHDEGMHRGSGVMPRAQQREAMHA